VAFTPDGATLLSGGRRIRFWSVATGREQSIAGPGLGVIESVAVSPNAQTAALADNLGNVSLWSLPSGKLLGVLPDQDIAGGPYDPWVGHPFLAFNAPGDILVAGSSNRHNSVNVWNVSNRQRKARCIGHDWPITAVACSRDGNVIISGSRDKTVRAWTTAGRSLWKSVGNGPQVLTVAFAPDDKRIYTGGHSNIIDVLSRESGAVIDQVPIPADGRESLNAVSVVAPSSSGRYLAAVTGESTSGRRVVVLDLERKQEAFRLGGKATSLHTPPDEIYLGVAFHPYRDVLAVVKGDGAVQLYQAPSGNLVASFHGHTAAANAVAWSGDGNRLLSGSSDGTAILWDTAFLEPR
jgi:WD40 repeat protein